MLPYCTVQGVLTMPPYIKLLFLNHDTGGLSLNISIPDLLLKLSLTILVPSLIGKVGNTPSTWWAHGHNVVRGTSVCLLLSWTNKVL